MNEECKGENSTTRFKFSNPIFDFMNYIRLQKLQLMDHHKFIMKFSEAHLLNLNGLEKVHHHETSFEKPKAKIIISIEGNLRLLKINRPLERTSNPFQKNWCICFFKKEKNIYCETNIINYRFPLSWLHFFVLLSTEQ